MRADRLISLLILLQTRGRLTARELAEELEVSERTIYRDIEALSCAGVPVYTERGPGGGCALLESYRTNLTGLNEPEVQALFLVSEYMRRTPAPLADLGISQELKAALLKLSAAVPASRQGEEARLRQRLHLDSTPWFASGEASPHLHVVHEAVRQDCRLRITFRPVPTATLDLLVEPYGLVSKAGEWRLVAAREGTLRVYHLADLMQVSPTGEHFERHPDFDLAEFWEKWCKEYERTRPVFPVKVRVAPVLAPYLEHFFGEGISQKIDSAGGDGSLILNLTFESLSAARSRLLGFGRAVEVLEPGTLRRSIQDYAEQILSLYTGAGG
jgi:predicted DNA-binding transcriptional regulator YafY